MATSYQGSFTGPIERSKEVLERCANQYDFDHITIAVSGGTDSVVAADVFARYGPEYDLEPDSITHINTGAAIPQSRLTAKIMADMHGLDFTEQGYRNQRNALGPRVLRNGWPASYGGHPSELGHGREWANRKDKPMQAVYVDIDGFQLWVSGARKLESKKRQGSVPDSGVDRDKPRRVWVSVIGGWTTQEKREYIKNKGLPVSEAYIALGYSGECTACAFDNAGLLTDIDLLCPELGHAIRTLALWLYQRVRRGDVELEAKRLCWGWEPDGKIGPEDVEQDVVQEKITMPRKEDAADDETPARIEIPTAKSMVGCDEDSCSTREKPTWVLDLPSKQIVDRHDVESHWQTGEVPQRYPAG